jgi:hypothetical protein
MLITTVKEQKKAADAARAAGGYDRLTTTSTSGKGNITFRTSSNGRFVTLKKK